MIALNQAYLCVNCEQVVEAKQNCPACGSPALISIAKVLSERSRISQSAQRTRTDGPVLQSRAASAAKVC